MIKFILSPSTSSTENQSLLTEKGVSSSNCGIISCSKSIGGSFTGSTCT